MAFRIKNLAPFFVDVMGVTLATNRSVDLLLTQSVADVVTSLMSGELYDKIQGRMCTIAHPSVDIPSLSLTDTQFNFLTHTGMFQSNLSDDDLKHPFGFTDGYLNVNMAGSSPTAVTSVRGVVADNGIADGIPVEIGGVDIDGYIQSISVNGDGYLNVAGTSTATFGPVADGYDSYGYPVEIGGVSADGYIESLLVSSDGELSIRGYDAPADAIRTFETAPVNTTFLLETIVDATNQSVSVYSYVITMDNYKDLSLEFELSANATMTLEISNDATFSVPKDITTSGHEGVSNTNGFLSFSNSNGIVDFDNLNVSYARVKLAITNATNSAKIVARKKAL